MKTAPGCARGADAFYERKEKMKKTLSNKKNQPIIGRNNATILNSKNTSKPKTVKSSSKGKSSVDKTTKTKKNFINIKI